MLRLLYTVHDLLYWKQSQAGRIKLTVLMEPAIVMEMIVPHALKLMSDRNYSDIENLLLFYFLQKGYFKRCKTVFKRKSIT